MNCPICGASAEQIRATIDGVSIVCRSAANTKYQVRSSLPDSGKDLNRKNAAMP